MKREIIKDTIFLARKSNDATISDIDTARDLLDTITAHSAECVGMAANMIGVSKRIIIFDDGGKYTLMFNPEIITSKEPYETDEGCLSLIGKRHTKRYRRIKVRYANEKLQTRIKTFSDFTAQIIQHEIDHCNGVII